ncbi:MAG: hypothetical protein KF768_13370 [Phycisphaeraceae bacterium]|nr:hypothetical protein [Phycisphaeraceae bacterium]
MVATLAVCVVLTFTCLLFLPWAGFLAKSRVASAVETHCRSQDCTECVRLRASLAPSVECVSDVHEVKNTANWNMTAGRGGRYIITVKLLCSAGWSVGCEVEHALLLEVDSFEARSGGQVWIGYARSWELSADQLNALVQSGFSMESFLGDDVRGPIPDSDFNADVPNFQALVNRH